MKDIIIIDDNPFGNISKEAKANRKYFLKKTSKFLLTLGLATVVVFVIDLQTNIGVPSEQRSFLLTTIFVSGILTCLLMVLSIHRRSRDESWKYVYAMNDLGGSRRFIVSEDSLKLETFGGSNELKWEIIDDYFQFNGVLFIVSKAFGWKLLMSRDLFTEESYDDFLEIIKSRYGGGMLLEKEPNKSAKPGFDSYSKNQEPPEMN